MFGGDINAFYKRNNQTICRFEISKQCREDKEAVIITVNGRGDTVSLSYEEYKNMKSRIELLEILAEAEGDVKNGRVAPMSETFDDLRAMLREG